MRSNDFYFVPPGTPTCASNKNYPLVDPLCGRNPPSRCTGDVKEVTCRHCLLIITATIEEVPW